MDDGLFSNISFQGTPLGDQTWMTYLAQPQPGRRETGDAHRVELCIGRCSKQYPDGSGPYRRHETCVHATRRSSYGS